MSKLAYSAVIFDMDGLLLDSERVAFAIGRAVCTDFGLPWREEVSHAMIGRNARDNAALLRREYGADFPVELHSTEFQRRYGEVIEAGGIPLKPGALALLEALQARGIPRAVATSTARLRALLKLERAGLAGFMQQLVAGDEIRHGKPAPDIFLAAAAALGVEPGRCLALEDSNAGARAALRAGMQVGIVPDLLPPDPALIADGARVLKSLHDVIKELE